MFTHENKDAAKLWNVSFSKEQTLNLRRKHIAPSIQTFFSDDPIKIVEGHGQYLYDENHVRYLDCINNVAHVGHSHPHVVTACTEQMSLLNTNSRFLHDNILHLAARLTKTFPPGLDVFFFVNSGSEANDLAMRIGRYYTKTDEVLVLDHSYHGNLISTMGISPYKLNNPNCEEMRPSNVHIVPNPDSYRGKYRSPDFSTEQLTDLYVNEVKQVCQNLQEQGKSVGIFILESMQSCGGQILYPLGYWKKMIDLIHEYGGLVVADEVQAGFGRPGKSFWGFQIDSDDISPDIITIAKSMGNGYPVGAVVTTRAIAQAFRRGPDYFNTYGGNPVSCAVSLAVLDVIENENLQKHALDVGEYFKIHMISLMNDLQIIGDVRGVGFFMGIDLVTDRVTRKPATNEAKSVLLRLKERHILMSRDGPFDNVLKFKPPMCFSLDDVDHLVANLKVVLRQVQDEMMT